MKASPHKRLLLLLAALCILLGVGAVLYYPAQELITRSQRNREIQQFQQAVAEGKAKAAEQAASGQAQVVYPELLARMQEYNRQLFETGHSGLKDAFSYTQAAFDLQQWGIPSEVIGVLTIPAMGEELPVYLGATQENLSRGVAVLGQTSMPVGGLNTNCVIAGHRGWMGNAFFREIERLEKGDAVYLTTYWGEKTYRVVDISIILPDDTQAIKTQAGRELLTLLTCHPYTVGTHRYVVYCEAEQTPVEPPETSEAPTEPVTAPEPDPTSAADTICPTTEVADDSVRRIQLERWLPFLAVPLLIVAAVVLLWPRKK